MSVQRAKPREKTNSLQRAKGSEHPAMPQRAKGTEHPTKPQRSYTAHKSQEARLRRERCLLRKRAS